MTMSRPYTHHEHDELLLANNGRTITLDGIKHVLRVSVHHAIYPYAHDVLSVYAEPKDKTTEYYHKTKRELGNDWRIDLDDSDPEVMGEVLSQLIA
jgi:hypothetical protein